MKPPFAFPFRQVHLDFHAGPALPDVGRDFDARQFARAMKDAYVNSVTDFAEAGQKAEPRISGAGKCKDAIHLQEGAGIRARSGSARTRHGGL